MLNNGCHCPFLWYQSGLPFWLCHWDSLRENEQTSTCWGSGNANWNDPYKPSLVFFLSGVLWLDFHIAFEQRPDPPRAWSSCGSSPGSQSGLPRVRFGHVLLRKSCGSDTQPANGVPRILVPWPLLEAAIQATKRSYVKLDVSMAPSLLPELGLEVPIWTAQTLKGTEFMAWGWPTRFVLSSWLPFCTEVKTVPKLTPLMLHALKSFEHADTWIPCFPSSVHPFTWSWFVRSIQSLQLSLCSPLAPCFCVFSIGENPVESEEASSKQASCCCVSIIFALVGVESLVNSIPTNHHASPPPRPWKTSVVLCFEEAVATDSLASRVARRAFWGAAGSEQDRREDGARDSETWRRRQTSRVAKPCRKVALCMGLRIFEGALFFF